MLTGCGGGGGGGGDSTPSAAPPAADTPPPEPPPADDPPADDGEILRGLYGASRLAARATFGMELEAIEAIEARGEASWLEDQFALPVTHHSPVVTELLAREAAGDFEVLRADNDNLQALFGRMAWWHTTLTAEDQLRQRMAYALSQLFVVSDGVDILFLYPYATSDYYDTLLDHAFGNFRDLLLAVTLHPAMGVYLSHVNNAKADPEANVFPDENYAREVMQLFSIGLFELNPDGTEKRDAAGQPVPTYDNDAIREFARVFTGLSWGGDNPRFGSDRATFREPMQLFEAFHDNGAKTLLRGTTLPAGQGGMADIEAAVDNLFEHPNTGPFIGRQLIQRLVTSNPSPGYVERVARAFNGESGSPRGDLKAVLRAILLDPEARALPDPSGSAGKLREPILRLLATLRQLGASSPDGFYANTGFFVQQQLQQHPLSAPSVFNFYLPDYQPIGEIAAAGLVAPEFQITNASSVVALANVLQAAVLGDFVNDLREPPFSAAALDFDPWVAVADDVDALLERMDSVFTYGTLSAATRSAIGDAARQIDDPLLRARVALYLLLISPDYAVEL
jgi:uncharacterized protein (DUF1800 family)